MIVKSTLPVPERRLAPFFILAPALLLVGALAAGMSNSAGGRVLGGSLAVLCAAAAIVLRLTLCRRPRVEVRIEEGSVWFGAFAAATLFGGSLFGTLLLLSTLSSPEKVLSFFRAPMDGGIPFFAALNPLLEWFVVPAALYLNWPNPRRRLWILAGAIPFYLMRIGSYAYFIPAVFDFRAAPVGEPVSPEMAAGIATWVRLSVVRFLFDAWLAVAFLIAASRRGREPVLENR